MKRALIFILALVAGCSQPMTPREQMLFGGMIAAQAADGWTTARYVAIGGTEANPMMDDRPSDGEIALFKAGFVGVLWLLGEIDPEHREQYYTVGIVSGLLATGWNTHLTQKYKGE